LVVLPTKTENIEKKNVFSILNNSLGQGNAKNKRLSQDDD